MITKDPPVPRAADNSPAATGSLPASATPPRRPTGRLPVAAIAFVLALLICHLVAHAQSLAPARAEAAQVRPTRQRVVQPTVARVRATATRAKTARKPVARPPGAPAKPGEVRCANLIYGKNKTSVCFSDKFLAQVRKDTHIRAHTRFEKVKLEAPKLCEFPFAVMTGEGSFALTDLQRRSLRNYLVRGGFIVASSGCSSKPWNKSFAAEMKTTFPNSKLETLGRDHPVFHTVYDITASRYKAGRAKLPNLKGLQIDGRMVLIWSPDGLNDTSNAGPNCCCCGGNEVKSAKKVNVNLLAYALTH